MKIWSGNWEGKAAPRIVCAACLSGELLAVGPRHHDSTMRRQIDMFGTSGFSVWGEEPVIQGFIDQFGDFYDRQEAWKIAEANGQIIRGCGGDSAKGGTLYSENLY
jgi:hypothetical protein